MPDGRIDTGRRVGLVDYLRRSFSRGLTVMLPILITIVVIIFLVNFLAGLLDPAVIVLQETVGYTEQLPDLAIAGLALVILLVIVLLVGMGAESGYGVGVERRLEMAMADVPGIGSIYTSIDELSEMLIDSDTESFREVKVIEFPFEGTYAMAFLTASSTGVVSSAANEGEMVTVFLPMAPNPMGGFLIHVPPERVYDVDLSVEEGIQTILSTGVTLEASSVSEVEETASGDDGEATT